MKSVGFLKSTVKILVPLIMLVVLIIGCAPQSQPAATPSPAATTTVKKPASIPVYVVADLSGPAASLMRSSVMAHEDIWPWINANGGIDGVPVNFEFLDSQGDKTKALAAYTKIRETNPRPACCFLVHPADVEALHTRAKEDNIVVFTVSPPVNSIWPPSWTFGSAPSYEDASGVFVDWLSIEWTKTGENRKCRLAFFNPDNPQGHSLASDAVIEYVKTKSNVETVANIYFDYAALDLSSDILKVMQDKPDYLMGYYYATSGAAFFRSLDSSGFRGKVKVASSVSGMQPEITLQVNKALVEGVVGPHYYPTVLPLGSKQENAGVTFSEKMFMNKNRPKELWGSSYPGSQGIATWVAGMLKTAVKENGWEKFNGQTLQKAIQNIKDMNCNDAFSWGLASPGKRTNSRMRMFQFKDGFVYSIGDFVTAPDMRPANFRTAEYGWTGAGWPAGYK